MFSTGNLRHLRKTLNSFPIPMFAVERPAPADAFRILCINTAHANESGLDSTGIEGLRPLDLLPPDEAEAVESRYAFCAKRREVIQYDETLHFNDVPSRWRTILHPVRLSGRAQRVIATSFPMGPRATQPASVARICAEMAQEEQGFGPVVSVLSPAPQMARRRIVVAEATFKTPTARHIAKDAQHNAANAHSTNSDGMTMVA